MIDAENPPEVPAMPAIRRETLPPDPTDEQPPPPNGAPPVRPSTAMSIAALGERVAKLEAGQSETLRAIAGLRSDLQNDTDQLRADMREDTAGMRKLLFAQLGVVVLVVCVLAGLVGVRVVLDGKGNVEVTPSEAAP